MARPLLVLALVLFLAAGDSTSSGRRPAAAAAAVAGAGAAAAAPPTCAGLSIAVVNGVPFHFEVLSGLLWLLRPYEAATDVYVGPNLVSGNTDGARDYLRWSRAAFKPAPRGLQRTYDLAILVSPDYELDANLRMLRAAPPRRVLALIHNGDFAQLPLLLAAHPAVHLAALSPHVVSFLSNATRRPAEWLLSVFPFQPDTPCSDPSAPGYLGDCLHGFTLQGKFSNLRRNYSRIWSQLQRHAAQLAAPPASRLFRLNLVGSGSRQRLAVPPDLRPLVRVHYRLPFRQFYSTLHRNLGLIPALASEKYYTAKFSSTIIASLQTLTPLIADDAFLRAYSFFDRAAVHYQAPGEEEVDVMLRVMAAPPQQIAATRSALAALRDRLNERAQAALFKMAALACSGRTTAAAAARAAS